MALVSPGVEVTIIDESNYIPAATNSVPYILLATAQNKISGTGPTVAPGTLAANAGKVYLITSQRDLASTFGNPFFYKTSAGTPINGYELNEYGLLAAHSVLGISNRAYIQRADVDLSELTASLVRPTGQPADGTYWFDTTQTSWGIFEWNQTTGAFTVQTPIVITNVSQTTLGEPLSTIGNIGNYAVVATETHLPIFYKNQDNVWVLVGTNLWKSSWPTVQGANSVVGNTLPAGQSIIINTFTATVPVSPNNNVEKLKDVINSLSIPGVTATVDSSDKLVLYADNDAESDGSSVDGAIYISPSSSSGLLTALGIDVGLYQCPALQQSPNYTVPRWRSTDSFPRPTGSVWFMSTNVNQGANFVVKKYDATIGDFILQENPLYDSEAAALADLDPLGGGKNLPVGTLFSDYDAVYDLSESNTTATEEIFVKWLTGPTVIAGDVANPIFPAGTKTFNISISYPGSSTYTPPVPVTFTGTTAGSFISAVQAAGAIEPLLATYVSAQITSSGTISFTHSAGGAILAKDIVGTPMATAGFNTSIQGIRLSKTNGLVLSSFESLTYVSSPDAPSQDPADGRFWYYSATDQVDIMIQDNGTWQGYRNVTNDTRGFNLSNTDPNGPIIAAVEPTTQSDGTALVYGDLWIDTSNLEIYPQIYRWQLVDGVSQWVILDNTDQTTSNGVLFADARWAPNGTTDPITDNIPTIDSLLVSDYTDVDAPDPNLFPEGMLLWNTRRSGFNVKSFQVNYFNAKTFAIEYYDSTTAYSVNDRVLYNGTIYICISAPPLATPPSNTNYWSTLVTNAWVTQSGNRNDGSPYMGRKAVRQIVVAAMKSAIDTQDTLREEQNEFNLIACPQYPELITNMVALNNERSNTAFIVGDTPLRLGPDGNSLADWANNTSGLGGEDGISIGDPYLAVFYPQCQTTDLGGSQVVQPASHMILRTIVRSDEVAYPWLAPAGVRRGVVDNAERLGYVNAQTGEFVTIATGQGLRDVLYTNRINPITFIPGVGITNYGNKTEYAVDSALNRINVARLVAYIRGRLNQIGKQFVFEPNDQITRNEITNVIDSLMIDLVAKRGIYDYLIVCDESNNTPARVDRNELYVDIAIEPVKAVEFIYIPVRIKNTGEIAAGSGGNAA